MRLFGFPISRLGVIGILVACYAVGVLITAVVRISDYIESLAFGMLAVAVAHISDYWLGG